MTDADRQQFTKVSAGLLHEGNHEIHSAGVSIKEITYQADFPDAAPDHSRPPHVISKLQPTATLSVAHALWNWLIARDPLASIRFLRGLANNTAHHRKRYRQALHYMRANRIDAVIVPVDTNPAVLPIMAAAHHLGLRIMLLRTANIFYHREDGGYKDSWKHHMRSTMGGMNQRQARDLAERLVGWIVARISPANVNHTKWGPLFVYLPGDILALHLAGCLPGSLWRPVVTWTDWAIASGGDEETALRNYSVPDHKIRTIGSIVFQEIFSQSERTKQLRREVCDALRLDPDRPIVMVTVTAAWEHHNASYEQQFGYLAELFATIRESGAQAIASLHPLQRREDYEDFMERYDVRILDRPLFHCITIPDIFIASDYSSVLRWAIAADVPAANVDFNPHNLDVGLPEGYPQIETMAEFRIWLKDRLAAFSSHETMRDPTARRALRLICDGQFFQRLNALLLSRPDLG